MPEIGQTILRYRVAGKISQGDMGKVYRAGDWNSHSHCRILLRRMNLEP